MAELAAASDRGEVSPPELAELGTPAGLAIRSTVSRLLVGLNASPVTHSVGGVRVGGEGRRAPVYYADGTWESVARISIRKQILLH